MTACWVCGETIPDHGVEVIGELRAGQRRLVHRLCARDGNYGPDPTCPLCAGTGHWKIDDSISGLDVVTACPGCMDTTVRYDPGRRR
jgi:hypothetical protein